MEMMKKKNPDMDGFYAKMAEQTSYQELLDKKIIELENLKKSEENRVTYMNNKIGKSKEQRVEVKKEQKEQIDKKIKDAFDRKQKAGKMLKGEGINEEDREMVNALKEKLK